MNKICTDIKQSKKLMELGIDVNTADMCYCPIMDIDSGKNSGYLETPECYSFSEVKDIFVPYLPAWSLSTLLGLIPPGNILLRDALNGKYKCINMVDSSYYDNPLDAAFETVCWLKENGKL